MLIVIDKTLQCSYNVNFIIYPIIIKTFGNYLMQG